MIKNQFNKLLETEMSRKEFLQHMGAGFLVIVGVSGLIKSFTQTDLLNQPKTSNYGTSLYGGKKITTSIGK